jgi:NAD(P)-dependent dehydrogenase (short-subunit alcohol dehydrogenase family)
MTLAADRDPFRLDGEVALITGASRGIGAATATEHGRLDVLVNNAGGAAPTPYRRPPPSSSTLLSSSTYRRPSS